MSRDQEIARFKKRLDAIVKGPTVRWKELFKDQSLGNLLTEFDEFAYDYFNYFATAYPSQSETMLVNDLNTALSRLLEEWAVISRACEQREIQEFKAFLAKADAYAQNYYSRFHGYRVHHARPITYFEKLYAITRYAFTPYPLISIPLYAYNDPRQWLALAHELGHFLFWNSTKLSAHQEVQSRLKNAVLETLSHLISDRLESLSASLSAENYDYFQKQPQVIGICMNWLEETFADVCGTLLAGPTYVIFGQRQVEEVASTPDELIADDEEHPAFYLRPLIGLETLRWVTGQLESNGLTEEAKKLGDIITHLEKDWQALRGNNWRRNHKDSGLKMKVIEDAIPVVVQVILEGNKIGSGAGCWAGANGEANLGELIDYNPWLVDLEEIEAARAEDRLPDLPSALKDLDTPEPSVSVTSQNRVKFKNLVEYLESSYKNRKDKVREVLLSLELGESHLEVCSERRVKRVGKNKGNYKRC